MNEFTHITLKKNSKAIRKKIEDAGIRVCICCEFKGSMWLDFSPRVNNGVHGIGYLDKDEIEHGITTEDELKRFIEEVEKTGGKIYFCKDVDELINKIKEYE